MRRIIALVLFLMAACGPRSQNNQHPDTQLAQQSPEAPTDEENPEVVQNLRTAAIETGAFNVPQSPTPIVAHLDLNVDVEHGCSQSSQSTGENVSIHLEISADDRVSLTRNSDVTHSTGPQETIDGYGGGQPYRTRTVERDIWKGTAKRGQDHIDIHFDSRFFSKLNVDLYWRDKLPQGKKRQVSLDLTCWAATVEAYKSLGDNSIRPTPEEQPSKVKALHCKTDNSLFRFRDRIWADEGFPLGFDKGLYFSYSRMYHDSERFFRLNPESDAKSEAQ